MIKNLKVSTALLLAITLCVLNNPVKAEDKHELDMQGLMKYCKTHTKEECHEMHAKIHMKHHGGTKKDFEKHYQQEHRKEKGRLHKKHSL